MSVPFRFAALVATAVLVSVGAAHHNEARHFQSERSQIPPGWSVVGRSHPKEHMRINIALQQRNLDELDSLFWAVSTPGHSKYGHFLSRKEISSIVSPKAEDTDRVVSWLLNSGVSKKNLASFGDSVSIKVPVSVAEQLFRTSMYGFVNDDGRHIIRQLGKYSVPNELKDIIQFVTGVSDFPMGKPHTLRQNSDSRWSVVPQTIRSMYNIRGQLSSAACSQSAVEFQDDSSYSKSDLTTFYKETEVSTSAISQVIGPFDGSYPDVEATLDVQYITAVGLSATNWYWTENNWMYDYASAFSNADEVPDVVSISWGWSEAAQCQIDNDCSTLGINSKTYVERVNTEFQKIGLRGVSILVASGDSGANGRSDGDCEDSKLHPDFPASSPYVTSVGATQIHRGKALTGDVPPVCKSGQFTCASGGDEVSVSYNVANFASGGGFSEVSSRQKYQEAAVAHYLNTASDLPPSSYFNGQGRGYPDVAALGNNFAIFVQGDWMNVGGTSASSPTFAGIVSLLNSQRLQNGQSKLGFLNPFLYKMQYESPATFNDITVGDNICTEDGCSASCKGFKAAKGWDPVSGLGSPNVERMISYINQQSSTVRSF